MGCAEMSGAVTAVGTELAALALLAGFIAPPPEPQPAIATAKPQSRDHRTVDRGPADRGPADRGRSCKPPPKDKSLPAIRAPCAALLMNLSSSCAEFSAQGSGRQTRRIASVARKSVALAAHTLESGKAALRFAMYSSSASSMAGSIAGGTYSASCFFQSAFARFAMLVAPSASHCS